MRLLVYAIADETVRLGDARGLEARPLFGIASEELTMVVSEHESLPEATEANLWEYEQAVERLMSDQTILPARFGTVLEDTDAALAALRTRHDELVQTLEAVRGAVELGIQGRWFAGGPREGGGSPASGTEYLNRRLELHRRAGRIESRLEPLRELARGSTRTVLPRPELAISAAYLVDRPRVAEFTELASRIDEELEEVDLECTGPWPPYSFVRGGSS